MKIQLREKHVDIECSGRKARFLGGDALGGFAAIANTMKWLLPRSNRQLPVSDCERKEFICIVNKSFADIKKHKDVVYFLDDDGKRIGCPVQIVGGGKEYIIVERIDKGRAATFSGDFINDGFRAYTRSMKWLLSGDDKRKEVADAERKEWVDAISADYGGTKNRIYFVDDDWIEPNIEKIMQLAPLR